MVRFFVAVAVLFFSVPALAQNESDVLSPVEFRDKLALYFEAETDSRAEPLDEWTIIAESDAGEVRFNTQNAYRQYIADPLAIESVFATYIEALLEVGATSQTVRRKHQSQKDNHDHSQHR